MQLDLFFFPVSCPDEDVDFNEFCLKIVHREQVHLMESRLWKAH